MPPVGGWHAALGRLRTQGGRRFWRGLDELMDRPDFRRALADEFPGLADAPQGWDRRDALRCLGASIALAGLGGCEMRPDERSMPYVDQPEQIVPGRMQAYATATEFAGYAQPVIGMTNAGRPTKLEGNPDHPVSGGATDAFAQAALLDLYDPDRATGVLHLDRPSSWEAFDQALAAQTAILDASGGAGFALLTGAVSSPTLLRQIDALLARWPRARWYVDECDLRDGRASATQLAFGRPLDRIALLDRAHAVVAFDADPLGPGPEMVANSLGWSRRRRAYQQGDGGSSLMVAEPSPTLTGGRAEHRLVAEPGRIAVLVGALAAVFGVGPAGAALSPGERRWLERAAKMLAASKGRGLVLVGGEQPPEVQALGFAIDARLGNLANTSRLIEPVRRVPAADATLAALQERADAGEVTALVILDADPVASPRGRGPLAPALQRIGFTCRAGLRAAATARLCQWHVPLAHALESWSDARAVDGTPTLIQPLVRPFFDVRGRHAVLAGLLGAAERDDQRIVRATWGALDADGWGRALLAGVAGDPAAGVGTPAVQSVPPLRRAPATGLALLVRPDPTVWDGRFANNPWAQELPKPFTTLTWDNAVLVAPRLAAEHGLEQGDVVRLSRGEGAIEGPVLVLPGQAPATVLVHLGYGRGHGRVSEGAGFDASVAIGSGPLTLAKTGERRTLAVTQQHHAIDGHDLVRSGPVDDRASASPAEAAASFFPAMPKTSPNWGMAIDLDLCTGCGACVTACNAENNIPMVGREQVAKGREMHWMRVDRYLEGDPEDPRFHNQPVPCMHCEDAPCEMGCPVNAAVHSPEGLNLQVYNRCIGTRTCSSFCPYKVRRFNWYDFTGGEPESIQAQRNPNVTVRMRGVMEKCTYCIQRISAGRIDAKLQNRPIRDGEVKTACQQVCPTGAISFGNIADPGAGVVQRKASPRDYTLLPEANTRPRTSYLARIRREDDA